MSDEPTFIDKAADAAGRFVATFLISAAMAGITYVAAHFNAGSIAVAAAHTAQTNAVADATSGTNWIGGDLGRANSNIWTMYFAQQAVNSNLQERIEKLEAEKKP